MELFWSVLTGVCELLGFISKLGIHEEKKNLWSLPSQAALGSEVPGCSVFFSTPFKIFLFIFYT